MADPSISAWNQLLAGYVDIGVFLYVNNHQFHFLTTQGIKPEYLKVNS